MRTLIICEECNYCSYAPPPITGKDSLLAFPSKLKSFINPRRACAARVTVVCVCVSVKSHLTSRASVRPETSVTYSAGNGGQKICRVFSETASFKSYGVICLPMAPYSDIAAVFCATFRRQSFLKLLKRLTVG